MTTGSDIPFILVSAACGLLVGLSVLVLASRRVNIRHRLGGFVTPSVVAQKRSMVERALGDRSSNRLERSPRWTRMKLEMEVAELPISPERLVAGVLVMSVAVGWFLMQALSSPLALLLGLFVPILGMSLVRMKADRNRRAFGEQLPDNLQVVASAMRAGTTFVGALRAVLDDAPEPSKRELRRAVADESLGVPLGDALSGVTERMKSDDFQHVAIVATLQRETGGNTAEVVDLVCETIRERLEIKRMVRGLTAQGRLAGIVLSMLPVGLLLMISFVNPNYTHPLFHTTTGLIALGAGVFMCGLGSFIIRRIVDVKI